MNFEKYIDDIVKLIEININRINNMDFSKKIIYEMYSSNYFWLTLEEHQKLNRIIEEIYRDNKLNNKFPKSFIFDKLVSEVIVKSYCLTSTENDIKLNLKERFQYFIDILNEEINDYTYFIPISGISVKNRLDFNSLSIYPHDDFKHEILSYFKDNEDKFDGDELKNSDFKYLSNKMDELNDYCFVKLTVKNRIYETSKDIALNKVNELLSIFSLYKPNDINGFGIVGDVLPLNSSNIFYLFYDGKLKTLSSTSVRNKSFNLTEALEHMQNHYLEYLLILLDKNEFDYVKNVLFDSISWYYYSVKSEYIMESDIIEVTLNSKYYHEHYNYFKLGVKLINLISSVESIILFNKSKPPEIRKKRFNYIMNYKTDDNIDYYDKYLNELYVLRNNVVHNNNGKANLLNFNIEKYTDLVNMFISMFVKIKYDYDNCNDKSLDSKKDLEKFYNIIC